LPTHKNSLRTTPRRKARAWLSKHKRISRAKRGLTTVNFLWVVAVIFLLFGAYYFPALYPFVKNDITKTPDPLRNFNRVPLPYDLTKPTNNPGLVAYVYLNITTNTDFIVDEPLDLSVIVYTPSRVAQNIQILAVVPDAALIYRPNGEIFNSFIQMNSSYTSNSDLLAWAGTQVIEYPVPGTFGLSLYFFTYNETTSTATLVEALHTGPMFSIGTQDSWILKRNQSLTMTLTFLLLFFVVIDLIREEKGRRHGQGS